MAWTKKALSSERSSHTSGELHAIWPWRRAEVGRLKRVTVRENNGSGRAPRLERIPFRPIQFELAASSIIFATFSGCETMTTWDAPWTTTVSLDLARSAIQPSAFGGMFLSALP